MFWAEIRHLLDLAAVHPEDSMLELGLWRRPFRRLR
jgi:hypothetical protein